MQEGLLDFGAGTLVGGFVVSACWGLFWLTIGTIGLMRRTCSRQVVLNSLAAFTVPLLLVWAVIWGRGAAHVSSSAFALGLSVMPLVVVGFGLRQAPDGKRAGVHMLDGVRHLKDKLLGRHQECGGCGHEQGPGGCP
jgi:hypothetical protein